MSKLKIKAQAYGQGSQAVVGHFQTAEKSLKSKMEVK